MMTRQVTCQCCGKKFWDFTSNAKADSFMKGQKGHVCGECANWLGLMKDAPEHREIIAGVCYDFMPPQANINPGDTLGGGRMRYILKKNGEIRKSNDIWRVGEVPQRFRDSLKDTGWWITRKIFYSLKRGFFECQNKGCFDRYHCLRYNIKQEYDIGPYNRIPMDWVVGDEKCPAFCNILDIEHYDDFETLDV